MISSDIVATWHRFVLENKSNVERELSLISINQRKLLIYLSNQEQTKELFSKITTQQIDLTSSSVQRAVVTLIEKDYVYIDADKSYRVLDPLIKSVLQSLPYNH